LSDTAGLLDLEYEALLGQTETLRFTLNGSSPKADLIAEDVELGWRGRRFYITDIVRRRAGAELLIDVEAPALWNRLADDKHVGTFTLFGITTSAGLDAIVSATSWTVDELDPAIAGNVTTFYLEATDTSYLDLLRKWAKVTGYELDFDTDTQRVRLVTEVGANRGIGFRYGRNVTTVEKRSNPPTCTRLYPYGAQGLDISGLTGGYPYLEDFTFYTDQGISLPTAQARFTRSLIWSDSSYRVDADLYAAAQTKLAALAAAQVSYILTVVDLSELTQSAEDTFSVGDTVRVADTGLGVDVATRVVRILRRPLDPSRSEIELAQVPNIIPDDTTDTGRSGAEEWSLFRSRPLTERRIGAGTTILNRLDLTTVPGAEWIVSWSLSGIAVGTGSVSVSAIDNVSGALLHPVFTRSVVDGEPLDLGFSFADRELAGLERSLLIRAVATSTVITINPLGVNLWVLARGTIQRSVVLPQSQRFEYTGSVQSFTVPDDITELTITAAGGAGGAGGIGYRQGGTIATAKYIVTPGTVFDVIVGGMPNIGDTTGAYPDGGAGDNVSGSSGGGGGGSSRVIPAGAGLASAYLVAGAAGGNGAEFSGALQLGGGGGFYNGAAGPVKPPSSNGGAYPGSGASQTAGGAGGVGGFTSGSAGTFGQGGAAGNITNAFGFPPGGGGGGWYGGGGAGGDNTSGSGNTGGGGGGSSWASTGYDLEYTEAANVAAGYVEFQWDTPA